MAATFDVLAGARDMATAADRIDGATYVELRGSHFIQMEQPDRVHALLRRLPGPGGLTCAGAALVVLAALTLAACSGGDDSATPNDTITATPAPTRSTPSTSDSAAASATVLRRRLRLRQAHPTGRPAAGGRPPSPPDLAVAVGARLPARRRRDRHRARHAGGCSASTGPRVRRSSEIVRMVGTIDAAAPEGEAGLLGVAVSPDFAARPPAVLLRHHRRRQPDRAGDVHAAAGSARRRWSSTASRRGFIHDGGRLAFGPDGYLYASTGETGEADLAQDEDSLGGKILRITTDGEPAPGNPDRRARRSGRYGHRNVQGLAFDDRDRLWASEFGQDTFDELNLIERGNNYGWPIVEGRGGRGGLTDPQVVWDTAVASPSGLAFLDGHLWLASLRGRAALADRRDRATGAGTRRTSSSATTAGCAPSRSPPTARLWVTTSNRDGRGTPAADDDRILVIDPS